MNEITYKQWHDEDQTFFVEFQPTFAQCVPESHTLSWAEILRITTDYAGEDFTQRGMPWQFLQDKGIVLIVSRISHHVIKMPSYDTKITLKTWESVATGPLCTRNFELLDSATGETLIIAQTLWTCFDLTNKKIMPAKNFPYRPLPEKPSDFAGIKPGKINIPEGMETIGTHKILYSELDSNGHTNNSKYINFAIDNLPVEFQKKAIKDLRLNYSREAHLGDEMEIKAKFDSEANKYTLQGLVSGMSSFECELYY